MAMQTCVVYGRLFCSQARQAVGHILGQQTCPRVRLVAVCCGFSKDLNSPAKKFVFGDDAYFIADNRQSSVMGEYFIPFPLHLLYLSLSTNS